MQTLIRPLLIKNLSFPTNLIQGPLAGYSCWPLRLLAAEQGSVAFCYSEMLSAKDLATSKKIAPRFSIKHPKEGPLCIQLSGTNPEELKKATERALLFGADLIDLNCGCPVSKIRQKGAGSKLLENPGLLKSLILAMKSVNTAPISIKIRVDGQNPTPLSLTAAQMAEEAGIDFITIHGRHWTESYETPCRQDQIAQIAEKLSIPVIANGDAHDTNSALKLIQNTGAEGIMISRACVGQPWIFNQIYHESQGNTFIPPSKCDIGRLLLSHIEGLVELEGETSAILQSRKLFKYYGRSHLCAETIEKAKTLRTKAQMTEHIANSFCVDTRKVN